MIVKSFAPEKSLMERLPALLSGEPCIVVVRPRKELRELVKNAIQHQLYQKDDATSEYVALENYFTALCAEPSFVEEVQHTIQSISQYLTQGMIFHFAYKALEDYTMARCSQLSARLVSTLCGGRFVDGCDLMVCEEHEGNVLVDWQSSSEQIRTKCAGGSVVVSGGYGRTSTGTNVRIGRGGSDLMATAIASVLGAERVEVLTTGDTLPGITALTYEEAAHLLSADEAPIFPPAMWPAMKSGIPVVVKKLCAATASDIVISAQGEERQQGTFTGVLVDRDTTLFTVYGSGLLGTVGLSSGLFTALARKGINIRFISQSSAEYSISFAIRRGDAAAAQQAIAGLISDTQYLQPGDILMVQREVSIVSVCGAGMRSVPGVSGKLYTALGNAGISIIAASQGGEEFSISFVVESADTDKAVAALHAL